MIPDVKIITLTAFVILWGGCTDKEYRKQPNTAPQENGIAISAIHFKMIKQIEADFQLDYQKTGDARSLYSLTAIQQITYVLIKNNEYDANGSSEAIWDAWTFSLKNHAFLENVDFNFSLPYPNSPRTWNDFIGRIPFVLYRFSDTCISAAGTN